MACSAQSSGEQDQALATTDTSATNTANIGPLAVADLLATSDFPRQSCSQQNWRNLVDGTSAGCHDVGSSGTALINTQLTWYSAEQRAARPIAFRSANIRLRSMVVHAGENETPARNVWVFVLRDTADNQVRTVKTVTMRIPFSSGSTEVPIDLTDSEGNPSYGTILNVLVDQPNASFIDPFRPQPRADVSLEEVEVFGSVASNIAPKAIADRRAGTGINTPSTGCPLDGWRVLVDGSFDFGCRPNVTAPYVAVNAQLEWIPTNQAATKSVQFYGARVYAYPGPETTLLAGTVRVVDAGGNTVRQEYPSFSFDAQTGAHMASVDLRDTAGNPTLGASLFVQAQGSENFGSVHGTASIDVAEIQVDGVVPDHCGDGMIQVDESCDDGNAASADGCSDNCQVEDGYTCQQTPSVCSPNVLIKQEVGGVSQVSNNLYWPGNTAVNAIDGNPETFWRVCTNGWGGCTQTQLILDLGRKCQPSRIDYQISWDQKPQFAGQAVVQFDWSDDESLTTWSSAQQQTLSASGVPATLDTQGASGGRYLRLTWLDALDSPTHWNGWGSLYELSVTCQ